MVRAPRVVAPALLVLVAFLALLLALAIGGGADANPLQDPGPLVRLGLPAAKLLVNLSAAATIGTLALIGFALTADRPEYARAVDIAAASAALFTVAAGITGFLSFLSVTGIAVSFDDSFGATLGLFLTSISLGQAWLGTTLIAAAVTVLCFAIRNQTALIFVFALSVAALVPMAQQGHKGGAQSHDEAVAALGLHLVFAAIWLGGLLLIVLLRGVLFDARLPEVLGRYSSVALVCFLVVAASGYVSAALRLGSLDNLATPYGALVILKIAALLALGALGALQRRHLIRRLRASGERRFFWLIVAAELVFMGIASGVAAALGRTATPVAEVSAAEQGAATPAELLTGQPLPPVLSPIRYFTEWRFDLIWVLACAFAIVFYLAGVARLRRRGDSWPLHRSVLWISGLVVLFYLTNGGINVYERYLFSSHMVAHMALAMVVPLLLVPAAPVTLALRSIAKRTDGSRGGREWILLGVHSRFGSFVAHPIVAAVLFAGSLLAFYYTPLFRWASTDHIGHEWMIVHFLITGYLFVQALIGTDPVPVRLPYPLRLLLLLGTMAFHAFFGLSLMVGSGLLLADWYGAMGWGSDALADQQAGGGIAWSIGEIPTVILAMIVALMWSRSDEKESRRLDRAAERSGDADLAEYNAMLNKLAARGL